MPSDGTMRFYTQNSETYAASGNTSENTWRDSFLSRLSKEAEILELGCGGGRDSQAMIAAGFRVSPTDGTPEMAAQAQLRVGVPVAVLRFADLDACERYDGIWANACLLHVPRMELADILERIHTALRSDGLFFASFKAGAGEGTDGLGRYYNYPSPEWLATIYAKLPWKNVTIDENDGSAYDKLPTRWLRVFATKA